MRTLRSGALTVLVVSLIWSCSETPAQKKGPTTEGSLVIEGQIEGGADEEVTLARAGAYVGFTFDEIAVTRAENGSFRFETKLEAPELLSLYAEGRKGRVLLFVGNEDVTVRFGMDVEADVEAEGSAIDAEFRRFEAAYSESGQRLETAESALQEAIASQDEALIGPAREARDQAQLDRKALALDWLERSAESTLGAYIGIRRLALEMDVDELEPLLATLDPDLAGTPYYDQLERRLQVLRRVAVGAEAPDFSGPTPEEEIVTLSSLRGSVVLIDYWASWCGPCREQNPELITLYEEVHEEGFEILGVGLEFVRDRWTEAIEADGLPWLNISDVSGFDMEAAQIFAIRSIPANVLLDREGKIVAKNVEAGELPELVQELL